MIPPMEDLNKHQIVLLTLLISFVTSIATGIMTTSLLQQAPIEVTRNINRIVEKTVETITPGPASTITKTEVTTVVVKEDDLIVDTIEKNIKSIVRIKEYDPLLNITSFYGIGLVLDSTGLLVSDRQFIISGNTYSVVMSDGQTFPLTLVGSDKQTNFLLFKAKVDEPKDPKDAYVFVPAIFSDTEVKLGQTVVSIGGNTTNTVSVGRVVSLDIKESGVGTTTTKYLASIDTDMSAKDLVLGSPLFNLSGDVVGIKTSGEGSKIFLPTSILKKEIPVLNPEVKKSE